MRSPTSVGAASSFPKYEKIVALWNQISTLGPQKRAANLPLHISETAQGVCTTVGKGRISNNGGAQHVQGKLRGRFAPDSSDSIHQDAVKFMKFRQTDQSAVTNLVEFGALQEKAE